MTNPSGRQRGTHERRQRDPAIDRNADTLRITHVHYQQLHYGIGRGTSQTINGMPTSMAGIALPIRVAYVDHLRSLDEFLNWWMAQAKELLDPTSRWELGVPCPYQHIQHPEISVTLVAWPARRLARCPVQDCYTWQGQEQLQLLGQMVTANTLPDIPTQPATRGQNLRGARPPWDKLRNVTSPAGDAA